MPEELISYLQLGSNAFALIVAGWIYAAYIKNLNSSLQSKDEQVKAVEKNNAFLKEQISALEKKSPENIEKILNERIKIREEEITRLSEDKKSHESELSTKSQEVKRLRSDLEKSKDIRRTMDLLELDLEEEDDDFRLFSADAKYEIEEMGMVAVDSGQLMITDPCYINSEWQDDEFEDIRLLKDTETGEIYQFRKDFSNYEEKISGFDQTVNELKASGRLEAIEIENSDKINFSYAGACYATMSEKGYGEMPFKLGHMGAGIAVTTVMGDGMYPVYAEKYDGKIVRVYCNLL
ncbi:hypothetical protein SHAM105786_10715 [Shewanella amazonensis]|uniref:Uncharacterized protein n=1 Tax=Shewanella amazonensis (strain ATCC BAA-1098 / SB2B) TaxID=326297 RepID=A1S9V6_SHEAM|nr:hypothetical protein [Shewanella amazonensis]ABM01163.1 hypothetical protein Sama_2960 [Shewanella amazonensis SB2B]